MSDNLANDVKRLERVGSELSGTNQKLLAAASRVVALILDIVPEDWYEKELGMKYSVSKVGFHGFPTAPFLRKSIRWGFDDIRFERTVEDLEAAHVFARDVANGFVEQLCRMLEGYLGHSTRELGALEQAEVLLKGKKNQD